MSQRPEKGFSWGQGGVRGNVVRVVNWCQTWMVVAQKTLQTDVALK